MRPDFKKVFERFNINTPLRQAHFLAQVSHESNGFRNLVENLNYSADGLLLIFPKYFNKDEAKKYARKPEQIANIVYGGRLGNSEEGDGWKYRGRGYIQLTGKENYEKFSKFSGIDFVSNPDLLSDPEHASICAGWFWDVKKLNELADKGPGVDVISSITKKINGGLNGLTDRTEKFNYYYGALNEKAIV